MASQQFSWILIRMSLSSPQPSQAMYLLILCLRLHTFIPLSTRARCFPTSSPLSISTSAMSECRVTSLSLRLASIEINITNPPRVSVPMYSYPRRHPGRRYPPCPPHCALSPFALATPLLSLYQDGLGTKGSRKGLLRESISDVPSRLDIMIILTSGRRATRSGVAY